MKYGFSHHNVADRYKETSDHNAGITVPKKKCTQCNKHKTMRGCKFMSKDRKFVCRDCIGED